jgi:hypothetical protein
LGWRRGKREPEAGHWPPFRYEFPSLQISQPQYPNHILKKSGSGLAPRASVTFDTELIASCIANVREKGR